MSSRSYYIVIGRQFGSGGKELGQELSKRLGIPCYDKTLIAKASERFGLTPEIIAKADERRPSALKSFFSCNPGAPDGQYPATMDKETLYAIQSNVIRQLAAEGPCIFVGRTADYILRDEPGLFSIFLHAGQSERIKNICRRGDASCMRNAEACIAKKDKERQSYYQYYTGKKWGMAENYHLCIDTSKFSIPQLADIICSCLNMNMHFNVSTLENV